MKLSGKSFTLIEILITLVIIAIAVSGLLYTYISCALLYEFNNQRVIAINDAQHTLEQIKAKAYNNISGFIAGFDPYQFKNLNNETVTFTTNIGSRIADITVNISWINRAKWPANIQLKTTIAYEREL